ncbi:GNAT family N-acetyltransferase [Kribbella sp. CA-293567]|uniref:GNAT family N-acetyltransferase n=1 Tax=Kribbella sp. CA-293567 TaxID=3002436 RepID=UPI0022DE226A|nr:GNAT family N-acetyltransferase [Kribbella sp. CA-293567]WBQ06220.1 GNAT family N-acetyltransferase [Kribbella sp. CA-293567]
MIELRELTADDWRLWRELRLAALEEAPYAFGSRLADWVDAEEERWRARLSLPASRNFVAVLDGRPVGMASGLRSDKDGVIELVSMWIAPAGRGRGLGELLLAEVERTARDAGARTFQLSVADGNQRAHALYLRSGFVETGLPGVLMPDGVQREIIMRKPL